MSTPTGRGAGLDAYAARLLAGTGISVTAARALASAPVAPGQGVARGIGPALWQGWHAAACPVLALPDRGQDDDMTTDDQHDGGTR